MLTSELNGFTFVCTAHIEEVLNETVGAFDRRIGLSKRIRMFNVPIRKFRR